MLTRLTHFPSGVRCPAMRTDLKVLALFAVSFFSGRTGWAQFVIPLSYTAPAGTVGVYSYFDDGGSQLTDEILGADDWTANLGSGNAREWVGWSGASTNPTLTFTFSDSPTIRSVLIGFNRGEVTGAIFLPSQVAIGGTIFSMTGSELPDNTRGFLQYDGSWTGNTLPIAFTQSGPWLFIDEVRFSTSAIPEPAVTALGLGVGMLATVMYRRKRPSPAM